MRIVDAPESIVSLRKAEMIERGLRTGKRPVAVPSTRPQTIPEDGGSADPAPAPRKKWNAKLSHPTYQIVGDECPTCQFPEAEGGFCENCGWSLPRPFKKGK